MSYTFEFCPERNVPETLPRQGNDPVVTMGGWQFTSRPTAPYQRRFKITLHGLRWYLDDKDGTYDLVTDPKFNARLLEKFYEVHETWKPFLWQHQHLSPRPLLVRFASAVTVPAGDKNSGGFIAPVEVNFIEHNPGFS